MKIKLLLSVLISIILVGLLVMIFMKKNNHKESELCVGTSIFSAEDSNNPLNYTVHYRIVFANNGKGYVDMRGAVIKDGEEYVIARNIIFNYLTSNGSDTYEVTITEITTTWQDNIPESLMAKYFPYAILHKKSYLKIDEVNKGRFLLSANQGPFLMCSSSS